MAFLRVPRERIIDAVPVALTLILMSVPGVISFAVPAVMLHIWMWLRHPRSRSRYFVFATLIVFAFGVFVGFPLLLNHLLSINSGGTNGALFGTGHIPGILMTYVAAGAIRLVAIAGLGPDHHTFLLGR